MRALVPGSHILFGGDYPFFPIVAVSDGPPKLDMLPELFHAIERDNAEAPLAGPRRG